MITIATILELIMLYAPTIISICTTLGLSLKLINSHLSTKNQVIDFKRYFDEDQVALRSEIHQVLKDNAELKAALAATEQSYNDLLLNLDKRFGGIQ